MTSEELANILRVVFPAFMVFGAFGSLLTNIFFKERSVPFIIWFAVNIQWVGASLLYTGLLLRNR